MNWKVSKKIDFWTLLKLFAWQFLFNFILRFFNLSKIIFSFLCLDHTLHEYTYISKQKCYSKRFLYFCVLSKPCLFQTTRNHQIPPSSMSDSSPSETADFAHSFSMKCLVLPWTKWKMEKTLLGSFPQTPAACGPCCWSCLSCYCLITMTKSSWIVPVAAPLVEQDLSSFPFVFLQKSPSLSPKWLLPMVGQSYMTSAHTYIYLHLPESLQSHLRRE